MLGYLKDFQRTENKRMLMVQISSNIHPHHRLLHLFTIVVVFLAAVVLCVLTSLACACCSSTFLHSLCYLFSVISFSVVNQRFVTALFFLIFFFLPESLSRILDGIVLLCVLTVCREKKHLSECMSETETQCVLACVCVTMHF